MNENNARPRGVQVFPMPEEIGGPAVFGVYALCVRDEANGLEVRMVHTEGVAYAVTDDKPWCWTDYDPSQRKWTPAELVDACKADPVDLADWVDDRNKARLESNFHLIYGWATSAEWSI